MNSKLPKNFFDKHNLLLLCGSGGVGKTTISAALALKAALMGYKTLVLTIDPAKRLATSLGIGTITGKPKRIDASLFNKKEDEFFLEAMMLDPKSTFDDLVKQYSPSKEIESKILNNAIYQHLSQMIAGSQEYMAMEKLYEVVSTGSYEVVVIDTPPATHAIDFLEAPQRMINALNHSMIHLLLKPALAIGKSGFKLFEKGSQVVLKLFDRITGFAFLQDISEMLISFKELLGGFTERAEQVKVILDNKKTAFLLVGACEYASVREATSFNQSLKKLGYSLKGILMNRVYPDYKIKNEARIKNDAKLQAQVGAPLAKKMITVYEEGVYMAKRSADLMGELQGQIQDIDFLIQIPQMKNDIHNLDGLLSLCDQI